MHQHLWRQNNDARGVSLLTLSALPEAEWEALVPYRRLSYKA